MFIIEIKNIYTTISWIIPLWVVVIYQKWYRKCTINPAFSIIWNAIKAYTVNELSICEINEKAIQSMYNDLILLFVFYWIIEKISWKFLCIYKLWRSIQVNNNMVSFARWVWIIDNEAQFLLQYTFNCWNNLRFKWFIYFLIRCCITNEWYLNASY